MKHYIYMVLAALCLSSIGVLVKLIGDAVPAMSINFLRIFIGFIGLLLIVPFIDKKWYKLSRKDLKDFFLVGAIYALSLSMFTSANLFTSVQNAVLINYSYPFFVMLFAYVILKEKVTATKIATLVIAAMGLALINPFQFGTNTFGNLLAFGGAFFYGLLITEMRKEDKTHRIGDVLWFLLFASLLLLPFPIMQGVGDLRNVWGPVVLLGLVSTGLAYLFYNLALEKIEAEVGSIIATIIAPLFSILLAVLILGEALSLATIVGGAILIFAGVYLETHNRELRREQHA